MVLFFGFENKKDDDGKLDISNSESDNEKSKDNSDDDGNDRDDDDGNDENDDGNDGDDDNTYIKKPSKKFMED